MRTFAVLAVLWVACKSEPPLEAAPEKTQPGVAVVAPKQEQQIRPPQVVLTPVEAQDTADAEDLYQQAYIVWDSQPERARRLFRQVVERAPTGSAIAQKAAAQLAAMDPPAPAGP